MGNIGGLTETQYKVLVMLAIGAIIAYILIKGLTINPFQPQTFVDSQPDRSPEVDPATTIFEDSGYGLASY